ncbi:unnamed protein product [Effrenium voratum]|uniref:Uncharacterized protein n=1 Tax=Effrenium voratum TaxID=2562239 RepID=A0AA36IAJ8_9DINO|nr:unnamed protein product [Effrenium voratum]
MVIPLPANESITALPDEARRLLASTKYFVFGLWAFSIVLGIFSPLSAISTWCLAIFGTYLLHEDPQMSSCYDAIRSSAIGQCCGTGGLRMLMPFFLLGSINSMVDAASLIQFFSTYGWKTFEMIPVDALLGIFLCELSCSIISYRVLKLVLPTGPLADGYQELANGPAQAGRPGRPLGGAGPGGVVPQQPAWKPFQGTGHKLGG